MSKTEMSDNNLKKEDIQERRLPLLILKFKCSSKDYINAMQFLQKRYSDDRIEFYKFIIIFSVIVIPFIAISIFTKGIKNIDVFPDVVLLLCYPFLALFAHAYVCIRKGRQPFMKVIARIFLKRITILYQHRTVKEIKKMIIPCQYEFYDTYFIKSTPSVEVAKKTSAEKVSELPLDAEFKIEYSKLNKILENDSFIFLYRNCFIPKDRVNKEDRMKLERIIKIYVP